MSSRNKEEIGNEMVGLVLDAFRDGEQGFTGLRNDQTAAKVGRSMQRIQRRLRELCDELEQTVKEECRDRFEEWCQKRGIPLNGSKQSTALQLPRQNGHVRK